MPVWAVPRHKPRRLDCPGHSQAATLVVVRPRALDLLKVNRGTKTALPRRKSVIIFVQKFAKWHRAETATVATPEKNKKKILSDPKQPESF